MLTIEICPLRKATAFGSSTARRTTSPRADRRWHTGTYKVALRNRIAALPAAQRRFELLVVTHIDSDHIGGAIKLVRDGTSACTSMTSGSTASSTSSNPTSFACAGRHTHRCHRRAEAPMDTAFGGKAVVVPERGGGARVNLGRRAPAHAPVAHRRSSRNPSRLGKGDEGAGMVQGSNEARRGCAGATGSARPPRRRCGRSRARRRQVSPDCAEANGSSIALLLGFKGKQVLLLADAMRPS